MAFQQKSIQSNLHTYLDIFTDESELFSKLQKQISEGQDIVSRQNMEGHATAGALILNQNNEVLLIFHTKLQRYLLPGGHIEEIDSHIEHTAQREMIEEVGIVNAVLHEWCSQNSSPILIDTHYIPANVKKNEEEHFHHDFTFVYKVLSDKVDIETKEVSDFKWVPIAEVIETESNVGTCLRKMVALGVL